MVVLKKQPPSLNQFDIDDDEELDTLGDVSESEEEAESNEDADSDEEEDVKLAEPSKTAINNKEGLLDKLNEISWPKNVDWTHTLSIVIDQEQEVDVNDDLAREGAIYTQALQGAREAFIELEARRRPFLRPADYYAEMVKSDSHMQKVKSRLLAEKEQLVEQERRRHDREQKAFSKQVQADTLKKRAQEKKENIESVKKWRKQRERSGFSDNKDEMALPFEEGGAFKGKGDKSGGKTRRFDSKGKKRTTGVLPGDRSGGKAGRRFDGKGKKGNSSRESKDSRFGFGGRKGLRKQNTADTTSDLRGFNRDSQSGNKRRKTK